ncbi:MAG TPA: hypothetical protein VGK42_12705 [Candidatus Dormibacteraeota bacterium]
MSTMSTDTNQIAERASTVEEVAFGAAKTAAEVASDPIGSARKQVKGLERKGTPTARRVNRRFTARLNAATAPAKEAVKDLNARLNDAAKAAEKVAGDLLPERIAMRGLHLVKAQARRQDAFGDAAKRTLKVFNSSFKTVAMVANRLERASELPARPAAAARRSRRSTRRTASRRSAAA